MTFDNCTPDRCNPKFTLKLEEELQFAKFLTNHVADAAFWSGPDAQFIYVNDVTCRLLEYSRDELLSLTIHDVALDCPPDVWSEKWRALKRQGYLTFESRHRTKGGRIFPVEIAVSYVEYHGMGFSCAFAREKAEDLKARVAEDLAKLREANKQLCCEIAEHKQAKAELEKFSLLQATLKSTADGVVAISCKGDIVSFNQKFVEMWQVPSSIVVSGERDQYLAFYRNQLKYPEIFCKQVRELDSQLDVESHDTLELKDGRVFESYSHPQRLGEQFIGRIWSFREIAKRKLPEEELQQSEAKFCTLAKTTDAITLIIQALQFCYVNRAAEAITGYKIEELLYHPDFRQQLEIEEGKRIGKPGESAFPQYQQLKFLTKSGEERWLDWSVGVFEFEGKPAKLLTVIDITKLKQAEVEICQALEQEKELCEHRARFASMVSHEFRTPLNTILFSTSLLRRHNHQWTEDKKLKYIHRIQTGVEQLSHLLDQVLIISRAEAGKLIFEPRALDLDQLCRDLVAQLQLSDCSQHTVTFRSFGECSTVCVDEKLLKPILTNLLLNAIKYSYRGSTVNFALSCQDGKAVFQIEDKGIGIPAADRQLLFEPFHRGGNVADIPGSGLGLAVVKKLLDIHGGEISVASEVGVGTTLTITLLLG